MGLHSLSKRLFKLERRMLAKPFNTQKPRLPYIKQSDLLSAKNLGWVSLKALQPILEANGIIIDKDLTEDWKHFNHTKAQEVFKAKRHRDK